MHAWASGGTADGRAVGDGRWSRHPEASNGADADELDNQPEYHHTGPHLRDPAGSVNRGDRSWVTSLVDKPSSEGAAAKHCSGSAPSIDTGGRWSDPKQDEVQRCLVQALVLAAATSAPAAHADCFRATYLRG
jgi:hypothetical protein